jgi:hypothetical protein
VMSLRVRGYDGVRMMCACVAAYTPRNPAAQPGGASICHRRIWAPDDPRGLDVGGLALAPAILPCDHPHTRPPPSGYPVLILNRNSVLYR